MKKVLSLVLVLIIMLMVLTGCVNIDYTVKLNKNGSGDITYIYGIQKSVLESLQMSADDLMGDMKEKVEDNEYIVEPYESDTESGFKATKHVSNITTDLSLEEAFGEAYVKDSEENAIKQEKSNGKTKYSQRANIDLTSMEDMNYMGITMKYNITLPTKVDKENTNGTISEDGKTISWNLEVGEVNEIYFEATESGNIVIWAILAVSVIAIVAVVTIIVIKKPKKDEKIAESEEKNEKSEEE